MRLSVSCLSAATVALFCSLFVGGVGTVSRCYSSEPDVVPCQECTNLVLKERSAHQVEDTYLVLARRERGKGYNELVLCGMTGWLDNLEYWRAMSCDDVRFQQIPRFSGQVCTERVAFRDEPQDGIRLNDRRESIGSSFDRCWPSWST